MTFHWFLPTNGGDGRHIVGGGHGMSGGRPASVGYLGQNARSPEQLGFEAALPPTGAWCEDAWLTRCGEFLQLITSLWSGDRPASASSCCPGTRIWRRRTTSARGYSPN